MRPIRPSGPMDIILSLAIMASPLLVVMLPLKFPYRGLAFGACFAAYFGYAGYFDFFLKGTGHLRPGYLDGRIKVSRPRRWAYQWRRTRAERQRGQFLAQLEVGEAISNLTVGFKRRDNIKRRAYLRELRRLYKRVTHKSWEPYGVWYTIDDSTVAEIRGLKGWGEPSRCPNCGSVVLYEPPDVTDRASMNT